MATELMGWNKAKKLWQKRYRGTLHQRSPRQLGTEPTKEASRTAANKWWEQKQAEIDAELGRAKQHPLSVVKQYEYAIANHSLYAEWHRMNGNIEEATKSETTIEFLRNALQSDNPPFPLGHYYENPLYLIRRSLDPDDLLSFDMLWQDRYIQMRKRKERKETPIENTIRSHIDNYLELYKARKAAEGKLGSYNSLANWLKVFREFVDPQSTIEELDDDMWENYFLHLSRKVESGDYSSTTAKNYQNAARMFFRNRHEKRLIEIPRNLTSRLLTFTARESELVLFDKKEIHTYLDAANDRQKLYILLCLNCGMYGSDIGKLKKTELDLKAGRIKRPRSKTRNRSKNVPTVDYPLWSETRRLLEQFLSDDAELVLLNENGRPLWREEENVNGKFCRENNIKSAYFHLQAVVLRLEREDRKPLKSLRKTGANILENSQFGRFSEHYLGEAPKTIASRHYAHKNGTEFDAAITWLGEQLGIS